MSEESRKPGSVAGAGAEETSQAPSVSEPAPLVPEARKPETAEDEHAGVTEDGHAGATEGGHAGVGKDEHQELERLRAEVRELREQGPGQREGTARWTGRRGRWRALVSAILITLGCVLAPVSVLGVWAAN